MATVGAGGRLRREVRRVWLRCRQVGVLSRGAALGGWQVEEQRAGEFERMAAKFKFAHAPPRIAKAIGCVCRVQDEKGASRSEGHEGRLDAKFAGDDLAPLHDDGRSAAPSLAARRDLGVIYILRSVRRAIAANPLRWPF